MSQHGTCGGWGGGVPVGMSPQCDTLWVPYDGSAVPVQ